MKEASEAPEKLYISDYGSEVRYYWHPKRLAVKDIEYTRTDTFVKKAETYLKEKFAKDVSVLSDGIVHINFETAINNFINYMKGE